MSGTLVRVSVEDVILDAERFAKFFGLSKLDVDDNGEAEIPEEILARMDEFASYLDMALVSFREEVVDAPAFKSFFDLDEIVIDADGMCRVPSGVVERLGEYREQREALVLARHRASACLEIDQAAEAARLRFMTPGEGQAWTYQRKEKEAEAALAADTPTAIDFPLLSACVPVDGPDIVAVAKTVLTARDAWLKAGAEIEGVRRAAKAAVAASADPDAVGAILQSLVWPEAGA